MALNISVQNLMDIMPPPSSPSEVPLPADWQRLWEAFGRVPDDYSDFLRVYGTGSIEHFIEIHSPSSANRELNIVTSAHESLHSMRDLLEAGAGYDLTLYPTPGGILPCAHTTNGDFFYWETFGNEPNQWPIVVVSGADGMFRYPGKLIDFVVDLLTQKVDCPLLPKGFVLRNTRKQFYPIR